MDFTRFVLSDLFMGALQLVGGAVALVGIISTLTVIWTKGPDSVDTRGPRRRFPK